MNFLLIAAGAGVAWWFYQQQQKAMGQNGTPPDEAAPERTDAPAPTSGLAAEPRGIIYKTPEEIQTQLAAIAAKDAALPGYKVGDTTNGLAGWYTVLAIGTGQICSRRASFELVGAYHRVGTQVQSPDGQIGTLDQNCLWQWVS